MIWNEAQIKYNNIYYFYLVVYLKEQNSKSNTAGSSSHWGSILQSPGLFLLQQPPVNPPLTPNQMHLFPSHFTFSVKTWADSKFCPTAALCQSLLVDVYWFLIGTDTCILRDRNITSIKNSTFCLSANTVGNLTKLLNMTVDANKTYVSPSEEYFKWVNLLSDENCSVKVGFTWNRS